MLVCHKWAHVIRTLSLFQTLVLQPNDGFHDCTLLLKKLEQSQQSSQVRRLIVFGGFHQRNDPNKLFHMFPQLHVLYLRQFHVLQPAAAKCQWQHSLERLVEQRTNVFSMALLKMGVFHRLTELSVTEGFDSQTDASDLFGLLKNTPSLRRLELQDYAISWQQFELLHTNVPRLSRLVLNSVRVPQEGYKPFVQPNDHLETLTIRQCSLPIDAHVAWVQYIVRKYSGLAHFTFAALVNPSRRDLGPEEYHERLIMPLIDGLGTQLETLVLKYWTIFHKLIEVLDTKGYHLKKLALHSLGASKINQRLLGSHQTLSIRELSLYHVDFESYAKFKVFKQLKALKLFFGDIGDQVIETHNRMPVALNEILAELPKQLEELTLVSCAVQIEPFVSSYPSNIRSLTFDHAELDEQVSVFISDYCRHLKSLSFILCQPGLSTILLPEHRLSCFEIFSHDTQPIFRLTMGNQDYYYKMNRVLFQGLKGITRYFDVQDTPAFATRTTEPRIINSSRPIIHLTCGSLNALYINTRLAI
jgi:hypothetical protein